MALYIYSLTSNSNPGWSFKTCRFVDKVTTGTSSYFTRTVIPSVSGDNWTLEVTNSSIFDVVMYLYEGDFNPDSPLTNLYRAVDDGNGRNPLMDGTSLNSDGITLNSGQKYVLVVASFFSESSGDFTVEIKGPGYALVHTLPVITSQATTDIDLHTATGNGNISYTGIPNATQHGVCWNTTGTPTITDNKTEEGPVSATGDYTSDITGLSINTIYLVHGFMLTASLAKNHTLVQKSRSKLYIPRKNNESTNACSELLLGLYNTENNK